MHRDQPKFGFGFNAERRLVYWFGNLSVLAEGQLRTFGRLSRLSATNRKGDKLTAQLVSCHATKSANMHDCFYQHCHLSEVDSKLHRRPISP